MSDQPFLTDGFQIDPFLFYDAIVHSTDDYIYIVDMATDMALVSENMVRDFELPGRMFPGLVPLWGQMVHEKDREMYYESIQHMLDGVTNEHNVEYQLCNRQNEYVWVACRGKLQRDAQGEPVIFAGVVNNLSRRGKVDGVTGLFTQQECERVVTGLLETGSTVGLLLLGLDDFTRINNLKDHAFGDYVLRRFAQEVQRMLPQGASMYRFDGDEFAVVCANETVEHLQALYDKIWTYTSSEHEIDGIRYYCTASGGIAIAESEEVRYSALLKHAGGALELSKQNGKHLCTVFTLETLMPKLRNLELSELLYGCVLRGMEGFSMVYQPLTTARAMRLGGAEALMRWSHPTVGNVSPVEFIPLLESNGMIVTAGKWALEQAVSTCKHWQTYIPEFRMNVNVSFLQMLDRKFVSYVRQVLAQHQLDPKYIVLELTESRFVTDMDLLQSTFAELREMGIRIAMDDFGTGYSSLGMLCSTPADIIKIDRAFISRIGEQDRSFNRNFIASVIQLCHSVGISVCVEGVEVQGELDTVRALLADSIQGYYVSKPLAVDDFEQKFMTPGGEGEQPACAPQLLETVAQAPL